jgi:molecular chaperone HscB
MTHPTTASALSPIPAGTDYFVYLLGAEKLAIDTADLTRRFHQASKQVHPDRFTTKGPEQQALSVEHAEFLNRAYRTLRDPLERARYVLTRHGVEESGKRVPVELAEEYFELQELAMETAGGELDPEVRDRLAEIKANLDAAHRANMSRLDELFAAYDGAAPGDRPAVLQRMAALINDDNYARSMRRDITDKFGA